jgi:DNA-binding transcriptional ArsR family regulator
VSHLSTVPADVSDADDEVFRALADPSRRLLLDSLYVDDGQTLGQLAARLSGMTRFGVMKHLRVLEAAGLVLSRKIGREKLHYLNPVPIRLIHDRWIGKYAAPWVGAMAGLKATLEAPLEPTRVYEIYIRTPEDRLWRAISEIDARGTWQIDSHGEVCRVLVRATDAEAQRWPRLLSSLKSLLETGEGLAYAEA